MKYLQLHEYVCEDYYVKVIHCFKNCCIKRIFILNKVKNILVIVLSIHDTKYNNVINKLITILILYIS